ncbi:MAG: TonB-dependent receptor [Prolixibacteraceae bacterium]|nr:TonB-dependent receptor [Prolixibacteraceae bacterium]
MKSNLIGKTQLLLIVLLVLALPLFAALQVKTITGTVTDEKGDALPGVTVRVMGTTRGVVTDPDGKYSIDAEDDEVLSFSFIGMQTQEISVEKKTVINVSLSAGVENIDEVVVVGYGVQSKESVVGAISQVSGEKLQAMKMGGSLENSLQGSLPGLTVISTDPTPGEESLNGITMLIRGSSSLGSNSPLVIVDGVERSFSNLDPNEVASISILKDASATAVYGIKGANGVIIVTTKRGRKGAVQLELSAEVSLKEATRLPEYLNAYETLLLRNEAYRNDQNWDMMVSDEVLEHYRTQDAPWLYTDFDWMGFLFKPGWDQNYNVNARGGNNFVQYFVSLGYLHEGDIYTVGDLFPYDYDQYNAHYFHDRYNFRNNLDFNITKTTKLSVNLGGNIKKWGRPFDNYTQETWFNPVTLPAYYPAEVLDEFPDDVIPYDQDRIRIACNPRFFNTRLDWLGGRGFERLKSNELNADVILEQKLDFLTKGLTLSGTYSYNDYARYKESFKTGPGFYGEIFGYYLNPADTTWGRYNSDGNEDFDTPQPKLISHGDVLESSFRSLYYKLQANYARKFGEHNVSATAVFSRRESTSGSAFTHYEENWVARATYDLKGKYFLEASVAHTGSENFAPGLRFGTFPATAAGWLVSEEKFWKDAMPWFNLFKMKYSWGIVGSDANIARWLYISEYTSSGGISFGYPQRGYSTIAEGNVPVSDVTWEKAVKQNLGFELGFFQNMITLNVDFYDEKREDILQERKRVPSWFGAGSITGNIGETKSHGFEVEVNFNKTLPGGLNLFASAYLTGNESRVVFYDEPTTKPFNLSVEGKPVELADRMDWYNPSAGLEVEGYYQNIDEIFMAAEMGRNGSIVAGDHYYLDFNGDGNIDAQDYVVTEHPYAPAFVYNAKFGCIYKNWTAQVDFYGVSDVEYQMRQGGMFYLYPFSQDKDNALLIHNDYWTPDNPDATYPAVHTNVNYNPNYTFSSFANVNGRYFRLKNARVSYIFRLDAFKSIGIQSAELALTGTNLFTFTEYPLGGDPEGANSGVDFGAYPQLRRYSLELKIVF